MQGASDRSAIKPLTRVGRAGSRKYCNLALPDAYYIRSIAGVLVFVSAPASATWQSTLLYGALFGMFCYATFDLTSLSLLKHWTWPVAIVDVTWGAFVTAISSTAGLLIANQIAPKV